jgi:hypothetical protein
MSRSERSPDHALVGHAALADGTLEKRHRPLRQAQRHLDISSRSTSLSGDGRKSSTILTRPISPLLYLTVGFFINRRSSAVAQARER